MTTVSSSQEAQFSQGKAQPSFQEAQPSFQKADSAPDPVPDLDVIYKDPIFRFFENEFGIDGNYIVERDVKRLKVAWTKNPQRVSTFLSKFLAPYYTKKGIFHFPYMKHPQATFCSTPALMWAVQKGVLTKEDVVASMQPNERWFFRPVAQQLETLFPGFRFPVAVYQYFDKEAPLYIGNWKEEATHVHYLDLFNKDPRPEQRIRHCVIYISSMHEQLPTFFDAYLLDVQNKLILDAYVKANIDYGKTFVGTKVPYSVDWAEHYMFSKDNSVPKE